MNVNSENKKSSKGLIILIISIIIILVVAGMFAYLFLKTDMFKSNEELFWKYMSQNVEMTNIVKTPKDDRYENKDYKMNINAKLDVKDEKLSKLNDMKINMEVQNSSTLNRTYSKISANYKEEKISELEFLKNNDTYALRNLEVANGYIGIKNEGLNEFSENLGIDSREIPNKLSIPEISTLLDITTEEKQHITQTYYNVVKNNINKKKYSKNKNINVSVGDKEYKTNSYSVTLTQKEYQNLRINALETLRTDSITLNLISTKMKNINKDSKYANINDMNEEISKIIEKIKQEDATDEKYVTFTVYEKDGKTVTTSIELIGKTKIFITYNNEGKIIIAQEPQQQKERDWKEIVLINKYSDSEEYIMVNIKLIDDSNIGFECKKQKTDSGCGINGKIVIYDNSITFDGELNLTNIDNIPEISESNNIVLNNINPEKTKLLVTKLEEQIMKVILEKKKIIYPIVVENVAEII